MSFSDDVRKEICTCITDKDRGFACLYGMIAFSRVITKKQIYFQSKSKFSADTFAKLFDIIFHVKLECKKSSSANDRILYTYDIKSSQILDSVFSKYKLEDNHHINYDIISTESLGVFTAGVFLACGSITNPKKDYHMEFTAPDKNLADELITLLREIGVVSKYAVRRGQSIVYIKGSESIEDTLTFIGAKNCTLYIMNLKIYKDIRNKANRIANCDSANIDKTVNASLRQIEDIKIIAENHGLDSLPDELHEIALLRIENPSLSLRDIGESLPVQISRSGVNHRFQRIAKIADSIRKELDLK